MSLLRFFIALAFFTGALAASAGLVMVALLMLRFPPVLIAVLLACIFFKLMNKQSGNLK